MFKGLIGGLIGSALGLLLIIPRMLFFKLRLGRKDAALLLDLIKKEGRRFIIQEELTGEAHLPSIHLSLCYLRGLLFEFKIEERMLQAGFAGVDQVTTMALLRWQLPKFLALLQKERTHKKVSTEIPVYILQPWDADKIGTIKIPAKISEPYLPLEKYGDIERDVCRVLAGGIAKTGAILYGSPGNGKSYLVRYFALKYSLPIYIVAFIPDFDNHRLIKMFSDLKGPAIVLFEDFDSYFKGRDCLLTGARFTFDAILNILDGVFATPNQLIFFLTANEFKDIDGSLSRRPSRFKFVREIPNPEFQIRESILGSKSYALATAGLSLDDLLFIQETMGRGEPFDFALGNVKENTQPQKPSGLFRRVDTGQSPSPPSG